MRIGIDAGGTFTDFVVLHDDGRIETFKLRSNPGAPAEVILAGLHRACPEARADVVHGSTVATNALLERKGARTAFVTTAGFEDLLFIGRQNRPELYNLTPGPRRTLADPSLCFGVDERSYFNGAVARKPSPAVLAALRAALEREGVESVAVCFLHSYRAAGNERLAAAALAGLGYVSASHLVCPEFREYERASTTWINAYVGPLMEEYLSRLEQDSRHRVSTMQSNGGSLSARDARRHAVRTILSGPAGGVVGASASARWSGHTRILGFDMGGTSTDVSLCDGAPKEAAEASIDGFPLRIPMLDIHTVGAGGGSIARLDEGGLLRVGPESAGSDPGPACYGIGELPTVTDAHVVLGRIAAAQLVAGELSLDPSRSGRALDRLAAQLGLDRAAAAAGVIRVANANMERAIRVVSVERGHDPRRFALVAFGGCGGLHACEIAAELGVSAVLVPAAAGVLSALGMLLADPVRDFAAGALARPDLEALFQRLEASARREMPKALLSRSADIRYAGQSYELNVPWRPHDPAAPFHRAHRQVYGYCDRQRPVEVVTLRVRARVRLAARRIPPAMGQGSPQRSLRSVFVAGRWRRIPVLNRAAVPLKPTAGPALVADYGATTLIPPGWRFRRDARAALLIERA